MRSGRNGAQGAQRGAVLKRRCALIKRLILLVFPVFFDEKGAGAQIFTFLYSPHHKNIFFIYI